MSGGSYRLDFGKRKGQLIRDVDRECLHWLTCRDAVVCDGRIRWFDCDDSESARWLRRCKPDAIEAARDHISFESLCWHCCHPLVPIGRARANGRSHDDWPGRKLHKKCWRELIDE